MIIHIMKLFRQLVAYLHNSNPG